MNFSAYIINSETRKRAIKCSCCGMSYSASDYKVLSKAKKLLYFKFKGKILCHTCLFKTIIKESNGGKFKLKLYDEEKEFNCVYDPEDHDNLTSDGFGGELF